MIQKAYSCIDCGIVNVFKTKNIDGIRCMKCGGPLVPMGEAITSKEHIGELTIAVKVDTTEIDRAMQKTEALYKQISLVQALEIGAEQPDLAEVLAKSR